jgi:KTSC domain/Protein of unknown function (DUF3006)
VSAGATGMTRHPDDAPILAVHFDRGTRTLRVELENGAVYDYADVPERVYDELARAPARDAYFRENVRDEFIGSRAGEVDLAEMAHERREDSMFGAPLAERTSDPGDMAPADEPREDAERRASQHTWVVDVIEDDAAAVEVDGRRVTPIPRWLLPADAKDGDVLRVIHARSASRSSFAIEVDHDATRLAYQRSAEQLRSAPTGGSGDIDLNA